ncbi:hypothetical protein CSA56_05160 [candidate division KSB3 bacterium]|uniref:Peptidase S54 rhomboid domain-containing protein n=1 Tax=candidate division KSB3 bacterium TaxID=2044937 RepID=A0A2G6KHS6_9BACT|nr:MAG: hypothetical protein CSA56_05160 [candidate division KSB3 bacterium]
MITNPQDERLVQSLNSLDQLHISSLVLSAAKIPHRVNCIAADHYEIYVSADYLLRAEYELHSYFQENQNWPPPLPKNDFSPSVKVMAIIVVGCLAIIFGQSGDWAQESIWFSSGAGNAELILQEGQAYRLVTALTLHADIVHLLGNCVLGGILLHFLLHLTGNGLGLFFVLLTSTLANYLNVIAHGDTHSFVGFSTAVFAVIGMLCTISFTLKKVRASLLFFMSVMSGLALLGLLGSSGERTDLGAHFFGLLCGLLTGHFVRLGSFRKARENKLLQGVLVVVSFGLVIGSWQLALQ